MHTTYFLNPKRAQCSWFVTKSLVSMEITMITHWKVTNQSKTNNLTEDNIWRTHLRRFIGDPEMAGGRTKHDAHMSNTYVDKQHFKARLLPDFGTGKKWRLPHFHGIKGGGGAIKAAHTFKLLTYAYPSFGITLLYPKHYPNPNP